MGKPEESTTSLLLNPAYSIVVEASAGSGKTWLLTSRIIRLLIAGAKPSEILAITFTRKAAQEMAARLNEWLYQLAIAEDNEVINFLVKRGLSETEAPNALPIARQLYENCLTAKPGITISTFDGWFLQLMQKAPLYSSEWLGFELQPQTSLLQRDAWQRFSRELQQHPQNEETKAFEALLLEIGEFNTKKLLLNFLQRRVEWLAYTQGAHNAVQFALQQLQIALKRDETISTPLTETMFFKKLDEFCECIEKLNITLAQKLRLAISQRAYPMLEETFFTQLMTPRKTILTCAEKSSAVELYRTIYSHLNTLKQQRANESVLRVNQYAMLCGAKLLSEYKNLKLERQVIDFADIEWHTLRLLQDDDHAAYIQAKLDASFRHILLDEFQDANSLQWQILLAWLNAYGADESRPSIFLVGDPKQSIYRFRGAEARLFGIAAEFLKQNFGARYSSNNNTYRNAPRIVDVVNRVFTREQGFTTFISHRSMRQQLTGHVELLPLIELTRGKEASPESSMLRNPLTTPFIEDIDLSTQREAAQLTERICEIVGHWKIYDNQGQLRPARYRDILILVRARTHLSYYEKALREEKIPFFSARKGGLLNTLEVEDVTALLEFLIAPFSDLKLLQVLRSPIFSCSDDDLIQLARISQPTWWQRLLTLTETTNPSLYRAQILLQHWIEQVDHLPTHDLLDRIYHEGEVIERYRAATPPALREQVIANLQAYIELALTIDSGRYPSLPKFIAELSNFRSSDDEDAPEEGLVDYGEDINDVVRIYTIHGAKGLEAPIVWLLDANELPHYSENYGALVDWPPGAEKPGHFSLYTTSQSQQSSLANYFGAEQEYAKREELNLLYVALTRAEQALFVSGRARSIANKKDTQSWYEKLNAALKELDKGDIADIGDINATSATKAGPSF